MATPVRTDITVDQGAVPSAHASTFDASGMTLSYGARISSTVQSNISGNVANTSKLAGNDDPFTEKGYFSFGPYTQDSNNLSSDLNGSGTAGYKIYGIFQVSGEADPGVNSLINAKFNSGSLSLWLDVNSNTALGTTGTGSGIAVTQTNTSDDINLVNFLLDTTQQAEANVYGGIAAGDFGAIFRMTSMSAMGHNLFTSRFEFLEVHGTTSKFKLPTNLNGANSGVAMLNGGTTVVSGGGDSYFAVPEPDSALLMGVAFIGLYATSRRRVKKA
jgi:hypothetical protein